MTEEHFNALPTGYKLFEYTIKSVLGHGGFGITYLAYDENLNKDVAIKEYLPAEFAVRQGDETVRPRSSSDSEDYEWGLERFMKEAQTLALFRHPSIVPVFRFFKSNGTAYMVMEYQEGESLAALMRKHRGEFTEEDLLQLVEPILNGLAEVHKAGYLHRDVKPGNIYIRADGTPVLLDFGAARAAVGRKSQSLTSIVTPGYAPLEQYFADGNQGPWTDIYALAAILYQAVAGRIPPEAPARVKNDPISSVRDQGKGRFSPLFLAAIDRALMVEEEDRPQTTTEWRDMLIGRTSAFPAGGEAVAAAPPPDSGATMFAGSAPPVASQPAATQSAPTGLAPAGREAGPFDDRQPVTGPPPRQGSGNAARVAVISLAVLFLMTVGAGAGYFVLKESGGLGGIFATDEATKENGKKIADNAEAKRRADEEAKRKAEEEARLKQEAEARRKAEEETKNKQAAEARRKAEEEARRKQEAEARRKAVEEAARRRAEAEAKRRADAERQRQLEAEKRRAEEKRKAEEERLKRETEDREEARRRREEEAKRRAEEERQRREEEDRKRTETANLNKGVSCPTSISALNGTYSHATDCFFVRRVFISALSTGIKGSTSRWRNSRSGNSGTLTVLKAIQRPDGTFCRQFQQTLTASGSTHRGVGMACFLGNQWKITS